MKLSKKISVLFDRQERKKFSILFLGMIVMGCLEVAGVVSIAPFMAVVSSPDMIHENKYIGMLYQFGGFTNDRSFLVSLGVSVIMVIAISNCYSAFMNWWVTYFSNMQGYRLSERLLAKYLSQPYLFFLNRNTSDLSKNVLTEINRIIAGVVLPGMLVLAKAIVTIFLLMLIVAIDPSVAIFMAITLAGCYLLIVKLARRRLNDIGVSSTEAVLERYKATNEALSGIKDLKLRGSESEFLRKFSEPTKANAEYSAQSAVIAQMPKFAVETLAFGGILALIVYFIMRGDELGEIIPVISLYAFAGYKLMPALQQIYQGITQIQYNLPAMDIIVSDLKGYEYRELQGRLPSSRLPFEKDIELDNISFYYPNVDEPVIDSLNLSIKANTTVGLVGATGSGKTTLVDILLGLFAPNAGELKVDGTRLTLDNIEAWQRNLGYVPQSIYLTDDSLENNIAFGIPVEKIDKSRVVEAAKLAELHDYIGQLSEGYQTLVGERGVRLSGGQRQRIGIARALYHNPEVLVLDEATSALDGITEDVIIDAIHNLSHKKTIIMIAHRLTTLKECDVIYMMEKGKVVESGTYEELMSSNIAFRRMAKA